MLNDSITFTRLLPLTQGSVSRGAWRSAVILGVAAAHLLAVDTGLSIANYQKVGQEIPSGSWVETTYSAEIVNPGGALGSALARVSTVDPASVRIVPQFDSLEFGPVAAGGRARSRNVFKVFVAASLPSLDFSKLQWSFQSTPAPPVASAGPDRTVLINSTVTLDGGLSTNPGGVGQLAYRWTFRSRPPGTSQSRLSFLDTPVTSFAPDALGIYVVELTVTNGVAASTTLITITVVAAALPAITVSPNSGVLGEQDIPVIIVGQNTNFVQGATSVDLGSGVTGGPVTVLNSRTLTLKVTLDPAITVGSRSVTVRTGSETAFLANGFSVLLGTPRLTTITPNVAQQGQSLNVSISGIATSLLAGATTASFGDGISVGGATVGGFGPITVTSPTTATAQLRVDGMANWRGLVTSGDQPGERVWPSGVYSTSANQLILFGGLAATPPGEPIVLNNDVWRLKGLPGNPAWEKVPIVGPRPNGRWIHSTVYDAVNDRMIVFGGVPGYLGSCVNDTWVLVNATGVAGPTSWLQLAPNGSLPSPRFNHAAVYDQANNRMIVFSGNICNGTNVNELWILSNANGLGGTPVWSQVTMAGTGPGPRIAAYSAYDEKNNRMIFFGGDNYDLPRLHNDAWVLTNANGLTGVPTWAELKTTGPVPSPRYAGRAAYDPVSNRLLIFGGIVNYGATGCGIPETWVLENANGIGNSPYWRQLGPFPSNPLPTNISVMAYDVAKDRIAAFGGQVLERPLTSAESATIWLLESAMRNAQTGDRTVKVRSGSQELTLEGGFSVLSATSDKAVDFTPTCGYQGTTVPFTVRTLNLDLTAGPASIQWGADIGVEGKTAGVPGPLTVLGRNLATGLMSIKGGAALGPRDFSVSIPSATVTGRDQFIVSSTTQFGSLLSASPSTGAQGQTLDVVVTSNLAFTADTTAVDLGAGIKVNSIVVQNSTSLKVNITIASDAALGARTIQVKTSDRLLTLSNAFSVTKPALPSITSISPNAGPAGIGGPVAIIAANTHFVQGLTQVDFGAGISVTNVNVVCPTCLVAQLQIAATAAPGSRTVTITTGTEIVTLASGFGVQGGAPILTTMNPATAQQGQTVTSVVTGLSTNWLQGVTTVNLGAGIVINSVAVTSPTSLTVQATVLATATLGKRRLTVVTGAETVSADDVFTVLAGTTLLTQLTPASARQSQIAVPIAITGQFTNFVQGVTQAEFGQGVVVNSITVASPTSLIANVSVASTATVGLRTVVVTTGTEVVSFVGGFVINPGPVLSTVDPGGSEQGQTLSVVITGLQTNFLQGSSSVSFGAGIAVNSITVSSPTTLTAQITIALSATPGPRAVTVTTGAEVATFTTGFTVLAGTKGITIIDPATGRRGQTLSIAITTQFTNFVQGNTQVNFGPNASVNSVTIIDSTHLTAQVSIAADAALGQRNITVTTGSETVMAANAFVVTAAVPAITLVNPASAARGQSNLAVAIAGESTHFSQATTQLDFGGSGVTVNSINVTSSVSLVANITITGAALLGVRPLTVTTGTEIVSRANAFTVEAVANQAPTITIAPTWSLTLPARLILTYTVADDGLPSGGTLTATWEKISGPGEVGFQGQTLTSVSAGFSQAGTYVLRLTATDTQSTLTRDVTITVTGTPLPAPTVSFASPIDGQEITTLTDVTGSVNSSSLQSWVLEYRMLEEPNFRPFATGNTNVANGLLGRFDPTLQLNGIAFIRLTATDTSGQSTTTAPISLTLTKNQKIGNFTVSFNDLTVPLAGLPIQVVRTYDSRNKGVGDFGVGWTLDIRNIRLTENSSLAANWTGTRSSGLFPSYCVVESKAHIVTAVLPDGTTYRFQPSLSPQCQQLVPIGEVTFNFVPLPNTVASLEIVGGKTATVAGAFPGAVDLVDLSNGGAFNPTRYKLTLPDGRFFILNKISGVETLTDLNGNSLNVTNAGIVHSSGKGIAFTRDNLNRITRITDPAGNVIDYGYDLIGNLVSVKDRENQITTFTYNANRDLLTINDPRGIQPIRNEYDAAGRLIRHTDAFGNAINYTHSLNTRQEIVADRLGNQTVNEYDSDGNVVKVTDAMGGVTTRTYDSRGNSLSETNALGFTRRSTFDAQNNRLTETDALGSTTTYTYNSRAQVLTITDPLNRVTTNTYSAAGDLLSTRDPAGNTTSYVYNSQGLPLSITDPLGGITTSTYDTSGNLTTQTDALGRTTIHTYDANGNKLSETKTRTGSSGQETVVTTFQYNKVNQLVRTTLPDGGTTQIAYNTIGKQSTTTDQLGRQTLYAYDTMGRLVQTTFPDGTTERSSYDAEGHRITSTDRANRITSYTYDALGRLTKTTFPDGATSSTVYDAIGQVVRSIDAFGNATRFAYDAAGRRVSVTNALNQVTSFTFDAAGNQTAMTDARGNTTHNLYDANNRRIRVTYADNTFDATGYDALGRSISKTDQAGKTSQYGYDRLGRLTSVTDAQGQVTSYAYDELGNRIAQTDAKGRTTRFAYDKLGRRIRRTLPMGQSETMTYDLAGNMRTKTDFNGRTTQYTYDLLNRLLQKTPDPFFAAVPIVFTYTSTGQHASMSDPSGVTTYSYDSRDRLLVKATPQGALTYSYDLQGNLTSMRSSNTGGTSVNYAYDELNRLKTVVDNRLMPGTTTYNYDVNGNLLGYVYPNGVATSFGYDPLNRLTVMTSTRAGTNLSSYAYTLGPSGNRTRVVELGGRQVDYGYDSLYRLTSEAITGGTVSGLIGYAYDQVGNRLTRTSTVAQVPPATSTYDDNDRLGSDTYDANGNTLASGGATLGYDFENRLLTKNGAEVVIAYDGDGNRVSKRTSTGTTRFLVDDRNLTGYAQVVEELSGATVQGIYTYGLTRISQSQSLGISFYGYDAHGSTRTLTSNAGAITDRYVYDAFGILIDRIGTTSNANLYAGEARDPDISQYYLRARYYTEGTGRMTTPDSVDGAAADPASFHIYTYVRNDPINRVDPSGNIDLASVSIIPALIGNVLLQTPLVAPALLKWSVRGLTCGPPIQSNLDAVLADVASSFHRAQPSTRCDACRALHDSRLVNAWDILDLFTGSRYPFYSASQSEFSAGTAEVAGACFAKGAINYSLFGKAQKLCSQEFGGATYSQTATRVFIGLYRTLYPDLRPEYLLTTPFWQRAYLPQALAFGDYGWSGSLVTTSAFSVRTSAAGTPAWTGDWVWTGLRER